MKKFSTGRAILWICLAPYVTLFLVVVSTGFINRLAEQIGGVVAMRITSVVFGGIGTLSVLGILVGPVIAVILLLMRRKVQLPPSAVTSETKNTSRLSNE